MKEELKQEWQWSLVSRILLVSLVIGVISLVMSACSPVGMGTFDSPLPGPLPEPGDTALLEAVLMQFISGGLSSVVVFWFLGTKLGKKVIEWMVKLLGSIHIDVTWGELARYTAIVAAGLISLGFYALALALGFVGNPGSLAAWINLLLALLGVGYTGSQVLYARFKDRSSNV